MNMSWDYKNMTRLACFVASGVEKYDRQSVEMMVETCGWEVAEEFYVRYEIQYDADCGKQLDWIKELAEQEE
tara:strand:- start:191 stop:406 length:216 start_codon:yes stop_codon:yes gene_type:complete